MRNAIRTIGILATGGMILQFGGCVSAVLADVFFAVGPLLL